MSLVERCFTKELRSYRVLWVSIQLRKTDLSVPRCIVRATHVPRKLRDLQIALALKNTQWVLGLRKLNLRKDLEFSLKRNPLRRIPICRLNRTKCSNTCVRFYVSEATRYVEFIEFILRREDKSARSDVSMSNTVRSRDATYATIFLTREM